MRKKKYELIPEKGSTFFRVKALISFSNVLAGDLGGGGVSSI